MQVKSQAQSVAVTTSLSTTQAISLTDMLYGRILILSGSMTAITFYECDTIDGTYSLCGDAGTSGVLTVTTAASTPQSVAIPSVLIGSRFVKMVASTGTPPATVTVVTKTFI